MGRRLAIAGVISLLVLILALFLQRRLFGEDDDKPAPGVDAALLQPSPARPLALALITRASAGVEIQLAGGVWVAGQPGQVLAADQVIRTSAGAAATLQIGARATVDLAGGSQFAVSEISRVVSGVRLEGGRMAARVTGPDGSNFRVEVRGSDAVLEAERGEFAVLDDRAGGVTVATKSGAVKLSAAGKSVEVGAGELSQVAPSRAPSTPAAIPAALLLKLGKPRQLAERDRQLVLSGQTTPGALVSINGERLRVGPSGEFTTRVPVGTVARTVEVRAEDVLGREKQVTVPVPGARRPSDVSSDVKWGPR